MKLKNVLIALAAIAFSGILWKMVYDLSFDAGFRAGYQQEAEVQEARSEFVEL